MYAVLCLALDIFGPLTRTPADQLTHHRSAKPPTHRRQQALHQLHRQLSVAPRRRAPRRRLRAAVRQAGAYGGGGAAVTKGVAAAGQQHAARAAVRLKADGAAGGRWQLVVGTPQLVAMYQYSGSRRYRSCSTSGTKPTGLALASVQSVKGQVATCHVPACSPSAACVQPQCAPRPTSRWPP